MYIGAILNIIIYLVVVLLVLGGIGYAIWRFVLKGNVSVNPFFSQKEAITQTLFLFVPLLLLVSIAVVFEGDGSLALTLAIISVIIIGAAVWLRLGYGVVWGVLWLIPTWVRFLYEYRERFTEVLEEREFGTIKRIGAENDSLELAGIVGSVLLVVLMYVVGRWLVMYGERTRRMADTFVTIGILGVGASVFFLVSSEVIEHIKEVNFVMTPYIWSGVGVFAIVLVLFIGWQALRQNTIRKTEGVGLTLFVLWWIGMGFLGRGASNGKKGEFTPNPNPKPLSSDNIMDIELLSLFLNAIALVFLISMILLGGQRQEKRLINLGALFLVLWVIVTYISWSSSLTSSGIIFILGGVLLLAVGYGVERFRRSMIESAEE